MSDVEKMSVEELRIAATTGQWCQRTHRHGLSHAIIAAADELARRASLYEELRDALVWFGDSQVTDGGLPPFSEIYDHDTEPHITAYSPEKGEHYADFLVRVHRVIAAKTAPPILSDSSGGTTNA